MAAINVSPQDGSTGRDGRNTFENTLSLKAFPLLRYCKNNAVKLYDFLEARGSSSAMPISQKSSSSAPLKNKPSTHECCCMVAGGRTACATCDLFRNTTTKRRV